MSIQNYGMIFCPRSDYIIPYRSKCQPGSVHILVLTNVDQVTVDMHLRMRLTEGCSNFS